MSCVFVIKEPKDNVVIIDTTVQLLEQTHLVRLLLPFNLTNKVDTLGPFNNSNELPRKGGYQLIQGLKQFPGLWSADIHPYRMILRIGAAFAIDEAISQLGELVAQIWPDAQFKGGYWDSVSERRSQTLLMVDAFPFSPDDLARLMAHEDSDPISFTGKKPRTDQQLWVVNFKPSEHVVRNRGWKMHGDRTIHLFRCNNAVWLSGQPTGTDQRYNPDTDSMHHSTQLEVDFSSHEALLYPNLIS